MSTRKKSRAYLIKIYLNNPDVLDRTIKDYIEEAVNDWQGCYHEDHPLRNNILTIKVLKYRKIK